LSLPIDANFSHNVQMSTKSRKFRGSPNLGVKGSSHPQFFSRKCVFSSGRSKKRIFGKKIFGGVSPTPKFFLFLENNLFGRKCFPLRSDVFFEQKIWLFSKVGVFRLLPPSPYLRRFWTLAHKILVSCSPASVLSKSVKICGPKFISFDKVGVFRFFTHIAVSLGNARFFSPRDAPDLWHLTLKLPYSTPITLSVCTGAGSGTRLRCGWVE